MRWIGWRALAVITTATVAGTLAAGCGGDASGDDEDEPDGQTPAAAEAPKGKGSPSTLTTRVAQLLVEAKRKQDCQAIELVNDRSFHQFSCPPAKAFRKSLRKFEVTGATTFGSGAVIDYRSGAAPNGASATLAVDPSNEWGISHFGLLYGPTVGTSDARSRARSNRAVSRYLRAVASRNCKLYRANSIAFKRPTEKGCKIDFLRTAEIGGAVAASGGASPRYLGGNKVLSFYGVTLRKPRPSYFTLSVLEASDDPPTFGVLNASIGPAPKAKGKSADERARPLEPVPSS